MGADFEGASFNIVTEFESTLSAWVPILRGLTEDMPDLKGSHIPQGCRI